MKKTWKPVVAGILDLIAGSVGLFAFLGLLIAVIVTGWSSCWVAFSGMIPGFVPSILLIIAIVVGSTSVLALIGGIYALQRSKWGLALAGSIAAVVASTALLGPLPVGIAAIVLTALSKDEFE
jgi:hypothetical protein